MRLPRTLAAVLTAITISAPLHAQVTPRSAPSVRAVQSDSVWVNTTSGVYHCRGSRYYGLTSRGRYMRELDARQIGHRPANGETCGSSTGSSPVTQVPAPQASAADSAISAATVWVNTDSRVYHCRGTRYYGKTKAGRYMSESRARAAGYKPAGGRQCT